MWYRARLRRDVSFHGQLLYAGGEVRAEDVPGSAAFVKISPLGLPGYEGIIDRRDLESLPTGLLRVGDRVRICSPGAPEFGTVLEHVPSRGGYMVQPDGSPFAGGFGYGELSLLQKTVWDWLLGDFVF